MKAVTAFFMAWGNFLILPCPLKRWDSKLNRLMLSFLPLVGLIIGIILAALIKVLQVFEVPETIVAFAEILALTGLCGFMHLDGFMDVSDAVLSRRPLERRREILKDSTVGAFAAISMTILMIGYFAAFKEAGADIPLDACLLIPVVSRTVSGMGVILLKPLEVSQYAENEGERKILYIVLMLAELAAITLIGGFILGNSAGPASYLWCPVAAIATVLAIAYGRKMLDGMNGDIAGYSICIGELAGFIALAISLSR